MNKANFTAIFGMALLVLAVPQARAAPITWVVKGTVDYLDPALSGTFSLGDSFTLEYTFESTTPDSNASSIRGLYKNAVTALTVTVGGYNATGPGTNIIYVDNDLYGDQYGVFIGTPLIGPNVGVFEISKQSPIFQLVDPTQTAFSSDALLLSPPDPADFVSGGTFLALEFRDPTADPFQFPEAMAFVSASVTSISVAPGDSTPPEVACAVDTDLLWPPNHKLVNVGLGAIAIDDTDPDPVIDVLVFADEDDEELTGDGKHSPDAKDEGATLWLRSECRGDSDGRVYLIVVTATDAAGNVGFDCCTAVVPKSQSKKHIADVDKQAAIAEAFCLEFGEKPPGFVEVGDGAIIGLKQ